MLGGKHISLGYRVIINDGCHQTNNYMYPVDHPENQRSYSNYLRQEQIWDQCNVLTRHLPKTKT
jgi:hypothetical protein